MNSSKLKKFSEKLNGRECGDELRKDEAKIMSELGVVFVFGASDDQVLFRGAINESIDAWDGLTVMVSKDGVVRRPDQDSFGDDDLFDDAFEKYLDQKKNSTSITGIWMPDHIETSWCFKSSIPHETVNIIKDGELYCIGMLFHVDEINHGNHVTDNSNSNMVAV